MNSICLHFTNSFLSAGLRHLDHWATATLDTVGRSPYLRIVNMCQDTMTVVHKVLFIFQVQNISLERHILNGGSINSVIRILSRVSERDIVMAFLSVHLSVCLSVPSQGGVSIADPNFTGSPLLMRTWLEPEQPNHIRRGNTLRGWVFLRGQPRHCICTNASRGLSATAERLVISCHNKR